MPLIYEVVYDHEERGVYYASREEAVANAHPGMEVWQLADDEPMTRMVCVWPEEAARRHGQLADEPAADVVPMEVHRIARFAAELVTTHPHSSYEQVVALVAYAYAKGSRDGYAEAAADADKVLGPLQEALRS